SRVAGWRRWDVVLGHAGARYVGDAGFGRVYDSRHLACRGRRGVLVAGLSSTSWAPAATLRRRYVSLLGLRRMQSARDLHHVLSGLRLPTLRRRRQLAGVVAPNPRAVGADTPDRSASGRPADVGARVHGLSGSNPCHVLELVSGPRTIRSDGVNDDSPER